VLFGRVFAVFREKKIFLFFLHLFAILATFTSTATAARVTIILPEGTDSPPHTEEDDK